MDWLKLKEKGSGWLSKYKYVFIVVLAGVLLMSLPSGTSDTPSASVQAEQVKTSTAQELEEILTQIDGVGRVRVMLTESSGSLTEYQMNEDRSADGRVRVETVTVTNGSREEEGLVKTVTPATYLGAIIVCQGADRPAVRLSVIQAVSNVTGIGSDRITVLKMK